MTETPGIQLRNLTLRVGNQTLLEEADAEFPEGGVTLIVGASGSGKSILLRLLAGLLQEDDLQVSSSGSVDIHGTTVFSTSGAAGRARSGAVSTGIIFQSFALFDELSAEENLRFARDHRARHGRNGNRKVSTPQHVEETPEKLLEEFGIPTSTPVSRLSGGEKQRLAIARTLAYDPAVLFYDEPTSGLDPANAARVARRIRATADQHKKTTVVVTHDYEYLPGVADAVFVLNPAKRKLEQISQDAIPQLEQRLVAVGDRRGSGDSVRPRGVVGRVARRGADLLERSGRVLETLVIAIGHLIPTWRSPRWGLRYLAHYLWLVASPSAWLYFGAAGMIAGFVSTHFLFRFLPHPKYTQPLLSDEILEGLGFGLYRILVPVLLTVLLAARCGAAVASDIGNRLYGHQIDAMRSLGVRPGSYLLTNILLAFLIATPFLVGVGFLVGRLTSLVVFTYSFPDLGANFWETHFHRNLLIPGQFFYRGTSWLLLKVLTCGVGIGAISYNVGMRRKSSGVEVSRDITNTIIIATLYVLVVHFAFAFFEFAT